MEARVERALKIAEEIVNDDFPHCKVRVLSHDEDHKKYTRGGSGVYQNMGCVCFDEGVGVSMFIVLCRRVEAITR